MRILTIKIYISFGGHQTQTLGVQSFTRYAQMYIEKYFKFLSIPSFLSVHYQIYKQEWLPHSVLIPKYGCRI